VAAINQIGPNLDNLGIPKMTKYICDGHEYNVITMADTGIYFEQHIKNNYGTVVAIVSRDSQGYWWTAPNEDPSHSTTIHESKLFPDTPGKWAVSQYVLWATENDTVEMHYPNSQYR